MKVAVILREAKDLQFRSKASSCRFFASLTMTNFRLGYELWFHDDIFQLRFSTFGNYD